MRNLDRFQGCLVGGGAGDALGYAVEFLKMEEIRGEYGPRGITQYHLHQGRARISDDTQMTLFTAAGLLSGRTWALQQGRGPEWAASINLSYRNWLRTQEKPYPVTRKTAGYTWLMNVPELYECRAPGNTCMSALACNTLGTMEDPLNHSKGCGGVMRVAPIGLYFLDRLPLPEADRIGAEAAALTHGHDMGYVPAAMLVHIVGRIAGEDCPIREAVEDALEEIPPLFPRAPHMDAFLELMHLAVKLSQGNTEDLDAIGRLGGGWVGDEALAIAVYCALRYPDDLEKCLVAAVNHSGDSDSTGAIAGNIVGASIGYRAIPEKFRENLELREVILEMAGDLCRDCTREEAEHDPVWRAKYVTGDWNLPR